MKRIIEFNKAPSEFQGPIIDWCNTLRSTTVCSLELHMPKTSGTKNSLSPAIIISLVDGSKYCLRRAVLENKIIPEVEDTIEHILPSDIVSRALISIKFSEELQPDLLFVLSVCYGTRAHELFTAPRIVTDSDFFALALILNVTRKCLPNRVISHTSAGSPMELLWKDVYALIQRQGYAFWADTIAEHTKNMTRELIYKATQGEIAKKMPGDNITENLFLAAGAVARVEALAERRELADPTVWDKAWDDRWRVVWQEFGPTNSQAANLVQTIRGNPVETPRPIVDGRVFGRVAGRSPVKFPLLPGSVTLSNAISLGSDLCKPTHKGKSKVDQSATMSDLSSENNTRVETAIESRMRGSMNAASSNTPMVWLGRGHLSQCGDNHEIWATPREIAVEMAWAVAWVKAVHEGQAAAKEIQAKENRNSTSDPGSQDASEHTRTAPVARKARSSVHPALTGAATALRATRHWLSRASQMYPTSVGLNVAEDAGARDTPIKPQLQKLRIPAHTSRVESSATPSASRRSSRPVPPPVVSLGSPSDTSRPVPFPMVSPTSPSYTQRVSFPEGEGANAGNQRTRSKTLTTTLRKHVFSRNSDHRRDSILKSLHAFGDTVRERRHRERKEDAQAQAKQAMISSMTEEAKAIEGELAKQASEAWERTKLLSSDLQYSLEQLAEQEWQKMSTKRSLIASTVLPVDPKVWKDEFVKNWEKAWKGSWVAAWKEVWTQAWDAAVSRGVEFGVEEVLDLDPHASRINFKQLESTDSYREIRSIIDQGDLSQVGRLEQAFLMMKELYRLYESLRHSISTIRDDCVEITIYTPRKNKSTSILARSTDEGLEKMTYFQLQKWIEDDYLAKKFQGDLQLQEKLKRLFIRGISEVWESASSVYKERSTSLLPREETEEP